jgi:mannose-1-phosphate guanylyltransferase/mannose-6-phosphate isomerase
MIQPVVIAGGKGVRLWPVSRESLPKPYVNVGLGEDTLLQATLRRLAGIADAAVPLVVCGLQHENLVRGQAVSLDMAPPGLVLEPAGRNTAPAICAAALAITHWGLGDHPMLVLPADHVITRSAEFAAAVARGSELAEQGFLVTFAITPSFAATGYGYLKLGPALDAGRGQYRLQSFVEKPDAARAAAFLAEGGYAWNSGMFLFRPSVLLKAFAELQPEILAACRASLAHADTRRRIVLDPAAFARAPSLSIDYAIMEKSGNVATVTADLGWSDVGDWQAIWDISPKDSGGNALHGDALAVDSRGSLLHSTGPLLVGIGLADMVAVATDDAVVVAPRQRVQDVKTAVDRLVAEGRSEPLRGTRITRPWGSCERLQDSVGIEVWDLVVGQGHAVTVRPSQGGRTQFMVTAGEGTVSRHDGEMAVRAGSHADLVPGIAHRVENRGDAELRLVAIRLGAPSSDDGCDWLADGGAAP